MSRSKKCFVCNAALDIGQIRTVDNLFFAPPETSNHEPTESLATILSDILNRDILGSDTHTDVLCKKCQQNCVEYDRLSKRLETLRQTISDNYHETKSKYAMEAIEIDSGNSLVEHSDLSNMYAIETVDQNMGEVFDNNSQSNESNEPEAKKVILIKSENDFRSYFTIAEIDESDDAAARTDTTPTTIHYGLHEDITQQYVIAGPSSERKSEKFVSNSDQLIEIDSSEDFPDSEQYQFEFHESSDPLSENIVVGDPTMLLRAIHLQENSMKKRLTVKKAKSEEEQRQLFVRDGLQFQCILCEPATEVIYDTKTIAIHLKTDHNEKIYVCDICGYDFRKRTQYNEHIHDHTTLHECEICKAVFTEAREYRLHKKTHASTEKVWACKICDKKYNSRKLLDEHMNMHTGERPYKCPHCVKDFASKYTLTAHMKTHNERERPFECNDCGKAFYSHQNLTQHARTHTGVKEYECNDCHKKFGSPHNLEVHKIVHTGHKPFICRTCGKGFARRAEIRDHERTHTGERPYKCDLCTSTFAQRSNLMSHKRATHFNDKRYSCETCNRSFKRRRLLEYHIKSTHTGERPFKCTECQSTFVYPEHFKKHMRIHSGVKPFACEVCGKKFNSRDNRNAHRYVHSDKKPYECSTCHQGFMRRPLLYAHMETQKHSNNTIIVNKPRIILRKDGAGSDANGGDDEIVYLNLNDDDIILDDEDYSALEEEYIVDDNADADADDDAESGADLATEAIEEYTDETDMKATLEDLDSIIRIIKN